MLLQLVLFTHRNLDRTRSQHITHRTHPPPGKKGPSRRRERRRRRRRQRRWERRRERRRERRGG
jgi:hypothetical protein